MGITVYIADKPSRQEDCHSTVEVGTAREATVLLWALAKQSRPEWAFCWLPMGREPYTNDGMRLRDVPVGLAEDVARQVSRQNKAGMSDFVTEALNSEGDGLAQFGDAPDFVELVAELAREWAAETYSAGVECYQDPAC